MLVINNVDNKSLSQKYYIFAGVSQTCLSQRVYYFKTCRKLFAIIDIAASLPR